MDKAVLEGLLSALETRGLKAYKEYPDVSLLRATESFAVIGVESFKSLSSGMGEYLGIRRSQGGFSEKEVYGKRLELSLYIEVYSPFSSQRGAEGISDYTRAMGSCFEELQSGIKAAEIRFGELCSDEELGCFKQKCKLRCEAFLLAETSGEDGEFLDFVLKGSI
jgi:hypothetical protein